MLFLVATAVTTLFALQGPDTSGFLSPTSTTPAPRHEIRGSISSTQVRSTLDGPLGWGDVGYHLSLRSTFPGDRTALLWTAGITHDRATSARSTLILSLGAAGEGGMFRVDPGAEFRWTPKQRVRLSAEISRRHQFAQSIRNDDTMLGTTFPAELFVGAGATVPVARSDLGVVTLEYRPEANTRLTGKAYLRNLGGLVLVAPLSSGVFAGPGPAGFLAGSGTSAGITMEAAASGPSYGLTLGYGLQRTRLAFGDSEYAPAYGVAHSLNAGALLMASPGTSVKVGVTAMFGRHGTSVTGPFEWESCNLLDDGCEFAGSPREATQELGLLDLPPSLRLDLGIRHRWLLHLATRDAELAIFGAVTNILDRQMLTKVIDPKTGARRPVDVRRRSPLVVGLDWRY